VIAPNHSKSPRNHPVSIVPFPHLRQFESGLRKTASQKPQRRTNMTQRETLSKNLCKNNRLKASNPRVLRPAVISPRRSPLMALAVAAIIATSALVQPTELSAAGIGGSCGPTPCPPNPTPPPGALFGIQSVKFRTMLDVPNSSTTPGETIDQQPLTWCANGLQCANQQWYLFETPPAFADEGGGLGIGSLSNGFVLDNPSFYSNQPGIPIYQWPYDGSANQDWGIFWNSEEMGFEIQAFSPPQGVYLANGLVLDVSSPEPGSRIILSNYNQGAASQTWQFQRVLYSNATIAPFALYHYISVEGSGVTGSVVRVYYMGFPYVNAFQLVPGPRITVGPNGGFNSIFPAKEAVGGDGEDPPPTGDVTVLLMDENNYVIGLGHAPASTFLY
jgi:hypothetical protein